MRIAFAGTPAFARQALAALHAAGHTIACVLTQPDRPAGRGLKLQFSPVKALALELGVPVLQPRSLRRDGKFAADADQAHQALEAAQVTLMVVVAYGLILPPSVLALMPCLNIHASLLPRWRGAAPIQRAIEAGDAESGVTIMRMDSGLDTGPMLLREALTLDAHETAASLHDRLAMLGAGLIVRALGAWGRSGLPATPQPEAGVTYAAKIEKAEAVIDWREPAAVIERRVRAFDPFPGAVTPGPDGAQGAGGFKIWRSQVDSNPAPPDARCGQILWANAEGVAVATGAGVLRLIELQRPGGKRLQVDAFLRGCPLVPGAILGAS